LKLILSVIAGPYINMVSDNKAVIWFETNKQCSPYVEIDGKKYAGIETGINHGQHHEIKIDNLMPNTKYDYAVNYGDNQL